MTFTNTPAMLANNRKHDPEAMRPGQIY